MARREWADKKAREVIANIQSGGYPSSGAPPHIAKALMAEHARAVRIAKRAKALQFHGLRDTDTNEFLEGYEAACVDILAALKKGRA